MDLEDEFDDIFADDGELEIPTVRGSANLDIQDYQGYDGDSIILDDELQEDIPSTPGFNPGAASATDVEGTSDFDMLEVEGGMDTPGMKQTTFGAHPWGPGSAVGYRPHSQQRTGMDLRALGAAEQEHMPTPQKVEKDSMHSEPEVMMAVPVEEPLSWQEQVHGNRNSQPSNDEIDPMTLYDRMSYEYDDSSQNVIGSGIFGMEEDVTWRPRDGIFSHHYAFPAYIGDEDELGVQQSEMWDSTAGEWRVTQPSAAGVSLARKTRRMKPSPFARHPAGPRSHIEAFGRKAARCLVLEAKMQPPQYRSGFLEDALNALGPGSATKAQKVAAKLVKAGYPPDAALEDVVAHLLMHATASDLTDKRRRRNVSLLPRLDAMSKKVVAKGGELKNAAAQHIGPLTKDGNELRNDLGALFASPASQGMGAVNAENGETAPANGSGAPAANGAKKSVFTTRNVFIAGGVGLAAYFAYANRDKIKKNLKKLTK